MLILSDADVRRALPIAAAIESQRKAFTALAAGHADLPLRTPIPVAAEQATVIDVLVDPHAVPPVTAFEGRLRGST